MVDADEYSSLTAVRELKEETAEFDDGELVNKEKPELGLRKKTDQGVKDKAAFEKEAARILSPEHGIELIRSYVDDPRNTDNAWMESSVFLFKVDEAFVAAANKGKASDDAENKKWFDIDSLGSEKGQTALYASHQRFVDMAKPYLEL